MPTGEHNLFYAFKFVKSDYVWPIADDDLLLPGSIDYIYEKLKNYEERNIDFILINALYRRANGDLLSESLLKMNNEEINYSNFSKLFYDIGPLTILASFTCSIMNVKKIKSINTNDLINICPIYSHVFAYLEAYQDSKTLLIKKPLVSLVQTTNINHWKNVGIKFNWYTLFPWTGGLSAHLNNAINKKILNKNNIAYTLNSSESGRYSLIINILVQFYLQIIDAIDTGNINQLPPNKDFDEIIILLEDMDFVSNDTFKFLHWAKKHIFLFFIYFSSKSNNNKIKLDINLDKILNKEDLEDYKKQTLDHLKNKIYIEKDYYISISARSAEQKPFIILKNKSHTSFRFGAYYITMENNEFERNWMQFGPDLIDPTIKSKNYELFNDVEDFHNNIVNINKKSQDNCLIGELIKKSIFKDLFDLNEIIDVKSLITNVRIKKSLRKIRDYINILSNFNFTIKDTLNVDEKLNTIEYINSNWYIRQNSEKTIGEELDLLVSDPILHFVLFGSQKNWSISPFYEPLNSSSKESETEHPNSYLLEFIAYLESNYEKDVCPFFDNSYYKKQLSEIGIKVTTIPLIHYISVGMKINLNPHEEWDEKFYISNNIDLKDIALANNMNGWLHWCLHGRFEKRVSNFRF